MEKKQVIITVNGSVALFGWEGLSNDQLLDSLDTLEQYFQGKPAETFCRTGERTKAQIVVRSLG